MIRILVGACLLMMTVSACSRETQTDSVSCSPQVIESLTKQAWAAEKSNNKTAAGKAFEKLCQCDDLAGCLNAANYYEQTDAKWSLFNERACELGSGNACFWLGEASEGDKAKTYYEKGCSQPLEQADGAACRMAGMLNSSDNTKASVYLEKGCRLEDVESCIQAYKLIKEPERKEAIKALACEIGIPEVCGQ